MHFRVQLELHIHLLASGSGEDVGVTGIQNGHGRAPEELTASGTELNLLLRMLVGCWPSKVYAADFFAGHAALTMTVSLVIKTDACLRSLRT